MADFKYTVGLNNVGSYQVSAMPYMSGNLDLTKHLHGTVVQFPYVTSWVEVRNRGATQVSVAFSQNGVVGTGVGQGHKMILQPSASGPGVIDSTGKMYLKVTELWLSGSATGVDVIAGLTNIPVTRINNDACSPNGSNWSGSYTGI
tara:strand:+ start:389 stop:826 length:438 start_codon:yes stop_codon:yes gene_type:complete